jgi:hypothetical protein
LSEDVFYNASSGALSTSLKRVSSSGTETSNGSGTEWFEAADYDSDSVGHSSAGQQLGELDDGDDDGGNDDDISGQGRRFVLLLLEGTQRGTGNGPGSGQVAALQLLVQEVADGHKTSLEGSGLNLRVFSEVSIVMSPHCWKGSQLMCQ